MRTDKLRYVPVTPAGTVIHWLVSSSEAEAWKRLIADAAHMPYKTKEGFMRRGYTVERIGVSRHG